MVMKHKTAKFITLLKQFAKSKTFDIVPKNNTHHNTYYISLNLYGKDLAICIEDIPHQMSTVTISMINGEECNFEYTNIIMDDAKAENNFMKFLEFYFDAIN